MHKNKLLKEKEIENLSKDEIIQLIKKEKKEKDVLDAILINVLTTMSKMLNNHLENERK